MKHFTSFYPALPAALVGVALSLSSCQPSTESTTAAGTTEAAAATSTHEQLVADHQQMEADHRTMEEAGSDAATRQERETVSGVTV
ncbi:hypothetical protein F1C16_09000 [Hymenobacter sp. NBH84]|uniref:Secreted protein n=1 Tax=Hymenobacter defluvii TaxID=2054411 RepID=A0ABS3TBF0_9BACT|nr:MULTISPECIES: hypothetical protein [Hymenobacter]MBO3270971.1 hypothetical protein [Hymenobacter defluvii]QNE39681.1 hypothetical protein F1C16_09000 [Hymenobacter sp. NBH84]